MYLTPVHLTLFIDLWFSKEINIGKSHCGKHVLEWELELNAVVQSLLENCSYCKAAEDAQKNKAKTSKVTAIFIVS